MLRGSTFGVLSALGGVSTLSAGTDASRLGTTRSAFDTDGWRDWQSPIRAESIPGAYHRAFSTVQMGREQMDTRALNNLTVEGVPYEMPAGLRMTVINVKRSDDGTPHYRYFSTESDDEMAANETWSSSKFMIAAAAAARIRQESNGTVGLDSTVDGGEHGRLHVGELLSEMHGSYSIDPDDPFSTNRLGSWFLDVAGSQWANDLMTRWIDASLSNLGISYGQRSSGFSKTFRNHDTGATEWVGNADEPAGPNKTVTTICGAEYLKRLVMHREDQVTRMPGFRNPADAKLFWNDLKTLFYGEPGRRRGGMSNNSHPFLKEAAEAISEIDMHHGNWRAFSKVGWGTSERRDVSEVTWHGYGCFPNTTDDRTAPELFMSVHYRRPSWASIRGDLVPTIRDAVEHVLTAAMTGELDQQAAPPDTSQPLFDLDGHWAQEELRTLYERGYVNGYQDGTLRPDLPLTRAEFATMITTAFDVEPTRTVSFDDIEDHWARADILRAAEAGYFSGYKDGTFRPEAPVRKVDAIVALSNGLRYDGGTVESLPYIYEDAAAIPEWARQSVVDAVAGSLVGRTPFPMEDRLAPRARATRAEVLEYIHNAVVGS